MGQVELLEGRTCPENLSPANRTTSNSPRKQILSHKNRTCMAAMSSLGRLGLSSRRGLILITNSKSTLVKNHLRGLATTVRRDERFFTKKHEWVEVEGTKGECRSLIIKISN